jgi:integrase
MESTLLDAAGHRRSPATMPGYHQGHAPRNKGLTYPADPPTIEEIVAVLRAAGDGADGTRLRALITILWRAGLRIGEALALAETDLDRSRGAVLVRRGKGGRRREVGMDRWAWNQLDAWLEIRSRAAISPAYPTRKPRHYLDLPARHRQLRDHRHGPLTPRPSDLRHNWAARRDVAHDQTNPIRGALSIHGAPLPSCPGFARTRPDCHRDSWRNERRSCSVGGRRAG